MPNNATKEKTDPRGSSLIILMVKIVMKVMICTSVGSRAIGFSSLPSHLPPPQPPQSNRSDHASGDYDKNEDDYQQDGNDDGGDCGGGDYSILCFQ